MKREKKARLEAAGWKVADTGEFLGLSDEEQAFIETKLLLADGLRQRRRRQQLTQAQLARRIGSSQSRVAKMEAGDGSVSMDLIIRSLLHLGATKYDIARLIRRSKKIHG